MSALNGDGWTRVGTTSGPCNTYAGRLQVRRSIARGRGPWVIVDLQRGEILAGGYPTMASARTDVPSLLPVDR